MACLPGHPAFRVCLLSLPACLSGLPAWPETLPHSAIFHLIQHNSIAVCRRVICIAEANYKDILPFTFTVCAVELFPLLGQTMTACLPFLPGLPAQPALPGLHGLNAQSVCLPSLPA